MSLANYLAKNYLSADKKPKKKKKKTEKETQPIESTIVETEDILGWEGTNYKELDDDEDNEDEIILPQKNQKDASKGAGWKKLGGEESNLRPLSLSKHPLRSQSHQPSEDSPVDTPLMSNGARAGLQTAKQVREDLERRQQAELKRFLEDDDELSRKNAETVYRDASGRVIDLAAQNNEKAKQEELERISKEARQKERNLGLVQKMENEARRQRLKSVESTSINLYADNDELNKELKSQYRVNDPAARFNRNIKQQQERVSGQASVTGLPIYKGPYNPNRFNIPPGIKWDGVDRSNGFEALYFKKQNERRERKTLSYTMAIDD